jgi:hypothetical protein
MSEIKEEIKSSGDPCLWLCFPYLFTCILCEKGIQSCCMCICCMTCSSQNQIITEEFKEENK